MSKGREFCSEVREANRGEIMKSLLGHGKEFGFYPKCDWSVLRWIGNGIGMVIVKRTCWLPGIEWILLGQNKNEICFLLWFILCVVLVGLRDAWIAGETLFGGVCEGAFGRDQHLNQSVDWVRRCTLTDKSGLHPICWGSEQTESQRKGQLSPWAVHLFLPLDIRTPGSWAFRLWDIYQNPIAHPTLGLLIQAEWCHWIMAPDFLVLKLEDIRLLDLHYCVNHFLYKQTNK